MERLLVFVVLFQLYQAAEWGYGNYGEDMWKTEYPTCAGTRQSPVDIPFNGDFLEYEDLGTLTFSGYDNMGSANLEMKNNGHTAVVSITNLSNSTYIEGGGLDGKYSALQFHFHWGADNHHGSEHTFRGKMYPLELHIVHYKQEYGNVVNALSYGDGAAVVGIFFEISDTDNPNLDPIINQLAQIQEKDAVQAVSLDFSQLLGSSTDEFYRYEGSLTTPGCNEAVIWTVVENKNHISAEQLDKFRQLKKAAGSGEDVLLKMNYRHVQPLGVRKVKKNYNTDLPSSFHWGYGREAHDWPHYYPTCKGHRQSPVNIPGLFDPRIATYNSSMHLDGLEFHNYDKMLSGTLINNGHAVQVNLGSEDAYIMNGGLHGKYVAAQFHYHWGKDNHHGSEHLINGNSFPLELHIVHYKKEYNSISESLKYDDGLAVVGFMFEVSDTDNANYTDIINAMNNVQFKSQTHPVSGFSMLQMTISNLYDGTTGIKYPFYRYHGGLTTPPCTQVVIWTVMNEPIKISSAQLEKFRGMAKVKQSDASTPIATSEYIGENFRPVQDLVYRHVFISADNMAGQAGTSEPLGFHWGYHGAEGAQNWKYYYATCEGNFQSPIDLPRYDDTNSLTYDPTVGLDTLEFENYAQSVTGTIKNNGHTIQVDIDSPSIYIKKGGLNGKYKALQFHFHWGADNNHGSEHTVDGAAFPLELHVVHYKESYGSVTNALVHSDGLAVIGFLFQVASSPNAAYSNIISTLMDVKYKGASKIIQGFDLQSLTLRDLKTSPTNGTHYPFYRYQGGLTTPPCSEIVTWSVMHQKIPISAAQVAEFRKVLHSTAAANMPNDFITKNYRPPQNLAARMIHSSVPVDMVTGTGQRLTSTVLGLVSALLCLFLL